MILEIMKLNSKLSLCGNYKIEFKTHFILIPKVRLNLILFEVYSFTTCTFLASKMASKSFNLVILSSTEDVSPRPKAEQQ